MKKKLSILILTILTLTISVKLSQKISQKAQIQKTEQINHAIISEIKETLTKQKKTTKQNQKFTETHKKEPLKKSAYLQVDFICQAPLQTTENWKYHEESCEEAAVLQAYNYQNKIHISKQEANNTILDMIKWQNSNFGEHKDLYSEDIQKFIQGYYKIPKEKIQIIKNAQLKDIQTAINNNTPIIAQTMGSSLNNPFYKYPGYHMLTITGYTESHIITNDNGTCRGQDFPYEIKTFMKSLAEAGGDLVIIQN